MQGRRRAGVQRAVRTVLAAVVVAAAPAAMSPAEREAYQLALNGPVGEPERGCAALQPDGDDAWSDETFRHFFHEASRLNAEARDSPAVAALAEEWRVCMGDAGVPGYATPADARADVQGKVDAARPGGAGPIPEPRRSELRELELRVATADVGCDERVGLAQTVDDAVRAAQTAYVEAAPGGAGRVGPHVAARRGLSRRSGGCGAPCTTAADPVADSDPLLLTA